jgi:hypothetical protein
MNKKEDYTFILSLPETVIRKEKRRNHIDYEKELFIRCDGQLKLSLEKIIDLMDKYDLHYDEKKLL